MYISLLYGIATHLCACGCRNKIVTPLSKNGWTLTYDGKISLSPSIGNYEIPCKSHYFITNNKIEWVKDDYNTNLRKKNKKRKKLKLKKQFPYIDYS
ncbi:MAG: hypothetical protein K2H85_10620 [Allobaculum sp.]|nr:hypothetical protein [Allobaculum sp.]